MWSNWIQLNPKHKKKANTSNSSLFILGAYLRSEVCHFGHFGNFYASLVLYFSFVTWAEFVKTLHNTVLLWFFRNGTGWSFDNITDTGTHQSPTEGPRVWPKPKLFSLWSYIKKYLFIRVLNLWMNYKPSLVVIKDKSYMREITIGDICNFHWMLIIGLP